MVNREVPNRVLICLCGGFAFLICLTWVDEMLGMAHVFFGGSTHSSSWREAAMETVAIVAVWVPTFVLTRRLIKRLHYLEQFLRVCAWCRKVADGDKWVPVEEYFNRKFDTATSHGMCPECFEKATKETEEEPADRREV